MPAKQSCIQACPFAYLLALAHILKVSPTPDLPQPQANKPQPFRAQVTAYSQAHAPLKPQVQQLQAAHLSPLTSMSQVAAQEWLHPILDFSIPPSQIYQRVSVHQFLDAAFKPPLEAGGLPPIVLIAPGGYSEAGVNQAGSDNFAVPLAIAHWRSQQQPSVKQPWFTGAEFHAYAIHHFLNRRLVIPIPDLWLLGVALLLAKGTLLLLKLQRRTQLRRVWVMLAIAIYGLAGLQLYLAGIVLPWLLPSVLFWVSVQSVMRKKVSGT